MHTRRIVRLHSFDMGKGKNALNLLLLLKADCPLVSMATGTRCLKKMDEKNNKINQNSRQTKEIPSQWFIPSSSSSSSSSSTSAKRSIPSETKEFHGFRLRSTDSFTVILSLVVAEASNASAIADLNTAKSIWMKENHQFNCTYGYWSAAPLSSLSS